MEDGILNLIEIKIRKMETKLKDIAWKFDEEHKELLIVKDGVYFAIPRKYLFSLNRFLVRIFQRGFFRKKK